MNADRLRIKMPSCQSKDPHDKDRMVPRPVQSSVNMSADLVDDISLSGCVIAWQDERVRTVLSW